ncbi:ABC transporter ATP-binding protein [Pleomorphovibrio marinus]|uniref:ABC transporter ATP-binding protein n=1 Tax=Pleomorphovibrio marinus TaxID=2164132 RepID=UPI000E0A38B7|nr:ATP-binding cassette domain-containing protein [Pleomorphovibrio marinus]
MLSTKSIQFEYTGVPAFSIPDIHLKAGEELLVLGESGSGKTTALNIIAGLLKPQGGKVIIDDVDIYSLKEDKLDKFRGKNIGIIFQKPHILSALTVMENLQAANFFAGKKENGSISTYLEELGIGNKKNAKVNTLSEGEAQRVSIARALVNQPKLLLADEPTSSLDDKNAEAVVNLLKQQSKKLNAVLIIVTHDQRVKDHIENHLTIGNRVGRNRHTEF